MKDVKKQSEILELKNTKTKQKFSGWPINRMDRTEERTIEVENRAIKISFYKNLYNRDMWDHNKRFNIHVNRVPTEEKGRG